MRLLENHDSDRFLLETPSSLDAYKQAVVLLLTIPGIPQLYYGQELLMTGTTKIDLDIYVRICREDGKKMHSVFSKRVGERLYSKKLSVL